MEMEGDDYTIRYLLDDAYFKDNYQLIAAAFSRKKHYTNHRAIQ